MDSLPNEILGKVVCRIPLVDFYSMTTVNHYFFEACFCDDYLWRVIGEFLFGDRLISQKKGDFESCKDLVKHYYTCNVEIDNWHAKEQIQTRKFSIRRWLRGTAQERRALLLGLDMAGKTYLLYRWFTDSYVTTIPTIGFNVETINYNGFRCNVWDVGGQNRIRSLWRHYYDGTNALIWVVNASDYDRLDESKKALKDVYEELFYQDTVDESKKIPLLFLVNRIQGRENMDTVDVVKHFFDNTRVEFENFSHIYAHTVGEKNNKNVLFDWLSYHINPSQ
eukprot:TRINITY_DN12806_c0_g1_i1.p1 TRINITY_DN12806_c0_g1~~TRINITY_DN12806_c0_g1_i1.p1  ORF type:complete len:279 (-),score=41.88 TRINITY_DN12806_c0_g1_i1:31-867(-)